MIKIDERTTLVTEQRRPGRPRIHDTPADRVRAHRERKRAEAQAAALPPAPTAEDPEGAVTALAEVLPRLRQEAEAMAEKMAAIAAQITAATTVLGDKPAVDAHLRRAHAEAAKVRADAAADLADMREQLGAALEDRANADAAAEASDADAIEALETLEAARTAHAEHIAALTEKHRRERDTDRAAHEQIVERLKADAVDAGIRHTIALDELTAQIAAAESDRDAARLSAQRDSATAAAAITRLEADLGSEKQTAQAERERADTARQDLNAALIELAEARAHTAAARERAEEMRAERDAIRAEK